MIKEDRISECNEIRRHKEEYLVMQLVIKMSVGMHSNICDNDVLPVVIGRVM